MFGACGRREEERKKTRGEDEGENGRQMLFVKCVDFANGQYFVLSRR